MQQMMQRTSISARCTRPAQTCQTMHKQNGALRPCRAARACFSMPAHTAQRPSRSAVKVHASSLIVKDNTSGAEFPLGQTFWFGEQMRCLGAGTRVKKVLLFNAKVYSVALYVEGTKAAKELGIRDRGGFFENEDDYCQAILDGAQNKALVIRLLRDVDGPTFAEALEESLAPRMQLIGDMGSLAAFKTFFDDKSLTNETEIVIFWSMAGDIQVAISPSPQETYTSIKPPLTINSGAMARALFELYLGSSAVVPEARKAWVQGVKNLLDYENVKRSTRKDGA